MPGEPPRLAALCRHHIHILVAVVLSGERDPFSIRGKTGTALVAAGRQLARFAAGTRHAPQVAAIGKHDGRPADGRVGGQQRRIVLRNGERGSHQHYGEQHRATNFHEASQNFSETHGVHRNVSCGRRNTLKGRTTAPAQARIPARKSCAYPAASHIWLSPDGFQTLCRSAEKPDCRRENGSRSPVWLPEASPRRCAPPTG